MTAYLNGTSSLSRSKLSALPYQGQITPICDEKEIQEIRMTVPVTLRVSLTAPAHAVQLTRLSQSRVEPSLR
jgi:hypothetical protein